MNAEVIANAIFEDLTTAGPTTKRLKVRTLLKKFGFAKRSDRNTGMITQLLDTRGIAINPPLIRFGTDWEVGYDDWLYLSYARSEASDVGVAARPPELPPDWNADGWFDRMLGLELRTEKEVEIKFIVPLLAKLGYSDHDRYDGMPVPAAHGSKATTLVIDFAAFNSEMEVLRNQPLLTVEAKHETRMHKPHEITSARNQAKSYCLWTQCDFFLVTDGRRLEAFDLTRRSLESHSPLFSCGRHELPVRFADLYGLISKPVLTRHYLAKLSAIEEAH